VLSVGQGGDVARAFGLGGAARLEGPVARGEQGQVWRLTTREGTWAVKEPFEPPDIEEAGWCAHFQAAAVLAGVPAPRVVRSADGGVVADVGSAQVLLYEWVDLGERTTDLNPALVGHVTAALHQVAVSNSNPEHWWYTEPVGAEAWDELVAATESAGAPFAGRLAAYRPELVALEELIEPAETLRCCHRDLWSDNVLPVAPRGVCVIDWENAGLADPAQELALVVFEFWRGDTDRAASLLRSYEGAGGPGRLDRPQRFSMVVAQLGHIGQDSCQQWLDAGTPAKRERAEGRVEEFLAPNRLDRATVDALLAAAAAA
jgi:aminoglycoside phosphotransferase (APT) family kinase protein